MRLTARQRQLLAEIRASRSGFFCGMPREANDLYALQDAGLVNVDLPRGTKLRANDRLTVRLKEQNDDLHI